MAFRTGERDSMGYSQTSEESGGIGSMGNSMLNSSDIAGSSQTREVSTASAEADNANDSRFVIQDINIFDDEDINDLSVEGGETDEASDSGWEVFEEANRVPLPTCWRRPYLNSYLRYLVNTQWLRHPRSRSNEVCTICYDIMVEEQMLLTLRCKHHFHMACVRRWLNRNMSCPNCRMAL